MNWIAGFVTGAFTGAFVLIALLAGWAYRIWKEDIEW